MPKRIIKSKRLSNKMLKFGQQIINKPNRITRSHYIDLECNALNNPDAKRIFDEMSINPGWEIIDNPEPNEFIMDYSVNFMYPHEIKVLDFTKK